MATIDFYYDVVSPYSFIAFELLERIARDYAGKLTIHLKPFLLGGAMQATENKPPASVPAKGAYMPRDIERLFSFYSIGEYRLPSKFPVLTIKAQRVLVALQLQKSENVGQVSRTFWQYYWLQQKEIDTDEGVLSVLKDNGFTAVQAAALLASTNDQAVKDKLRANTEEAVKKGAFGAPTFIVKKGPTAKEEMFFGSDRMPLILHHLGFISRAKY